MEKPLVSICCICYNQEQYIRQALDGFVMQQTNFPFEVVISDDCSKDGTRAVIREYKERHPNLIHDISKDYNQGAIPNWLYVIDSAKGKYVATCEGDDYWTNPMKLQRQVDYMESHPECVMCYHNAWQTWGEQRRIFADSSRKSARISLEELLTVWHIPTASVMYRRDVERSIPQLNLHPNGDYCLELRLKSRGEIHYDPAIMSVYRMHGDSMSAGMNRNKVKMYQDIVDLLQDARSLYPSPEDQALFDNAVKKYEHLIWDYQISNHPIKKWFYRKTYTRAIKKWIGKLLNNKILHI